MGTPARFALLLTAAALSLSKLHAQACFPTDTRVGDFQFVMPAGWQRVEVRGNPALVPGDVPRGSVAQIGLFPAEPLSGDLRSWFDAKWTALLQSFRAVDAYDPKPDRTAEGLESLRAYSRVSNPTFGFGTFVLGAVRVGTRVAAYYFVDNSGRDSYLEIDLPSFEHSLRFTPAAPESSGTAAALDGLYIGYRMRGATPSEQTHFEYLAFFTDGTAIRFLPERGLDHFDFAAEAKKSRDYCGCYRVNGDRVTITWGNNDTETAALARPEGTLKIAGDSYFPVAPASGLVLDGTYTVAGSDAAKPSIRFTPDGHFTATGLLPLVLHAETSEQRVAGADGTGTYRITRNTLRLQYDDGRTVLLSFYVWPAEPGSRPAAIHVNTYRLVRG